MGAAIPKVKYWRVGGGGSLQLTKGSSREICFQVQREKPSNAKLGFQMDVFLLLRCGQCQLIINQASIMQVAGTSDLFGAFWCKEP